MTEGAHPASTIRFWMTATSRLKVAGVSCADGELGARPNSASQPRTAGLATRHEWRSFASVASCRARRPPKLDEATDALHAKALQNSFDRRRQPFQISRRKPGFRRQRLRTDIRVPHKSIQEVVIDLP